MRNKDSGPDVRGTVEHLIGRIPGSRATQGDIMQALTQAAAAVADAQAERDHWRAVAGIAQTEMVMLASVILKSDRGRIVVKSEDFQAISNRGLELHTSNPDPGVRVYELKAKAKVLNG